MRELTAKGRQRIATYVEGVSINLPFVTFNVRPDDLEQQVAREIVIRLADRRFISYGEHRCHGHTEEVIASLKEVRSMLVDKQVALAKCANGPLYLIIDFMLEGIRQLLTFEERLRKSEARFLIIPPARTLHEDKTEMLIAALLLLRDHLQRCLNQISKIADLNQADAVQKSKYIEEWQLEAYEPPSLITNAAKPK